MVRVDEVVTMQTRRKLERRFLQSHQIFPNHHLQPSSHIPPFASLIRRTTGNVDGLWERFQIIPFVLRVVSSEISQPIHYGFVFFTEGFDMLFRYPGSSM
jgi:hypothetical protein